MHISARQVQEGLAADLDRIFAAPALTRALVGIHIESLGSGRVLYSRDAQKLVVPASNMKILTMAAAADRLGWDHRFVTTIEAAGPVAAGVLKGDLVVTGSGDPSVVAQDLRHAAVFGEWATALAAAGIRRVEGRLIGDDDAFDDEGIGAGWAWDYLTANYAAPSGALSYNENVVTARVTPGDVTGAPAHVVMVPPGSQFEIVNNVETGPAGSPVTLSLTRLPGSARLIVRGRVPAKGAPVSRITTIDNPTRFFRRSLEAVAGRARHSP